LDPNPIDGLSADPGLPDNLPEKRKVNPGKGHGLRLSRVISIWGPNHGTNAQFLLIYSQIPINDLTIFEFHLFSRFHWTQKPYLGLHYMGASLGLF